MIDLDELEARSRLCAEATLPGDQLRSIVALIREAQGIIHGLYLGFAHAMTLTQLDEVKAFLDKTKEST